MPTHRANDRIQFDQLRTSEVELVFVRLIDGPHRIITKRCARVLDMRTQHVCHAMVRDERRETVDAPGECGSVANVESSGVKRVAREENSGPTVVDGDAGRLMSGDWKNVQDTAAQVEHTAIRRPMS